jgi:hypothetical protein
MEKSEVFLCLDAITPKPCQDPFGAARKPSNKVVCMFIISQFLNQQNKSCHIQINFPLKIDII